MAATRKKFVRTQQSFSNIQSTQKVLVMKLNPIAKPSSLPVRERFALLNSTARALLSFLANMVPTGMSTLTITQSEMAAAIGKTTRTVQNLLKACVAVRLIVPSKSRNRFAPTRIEFENIDLVELIKQNHVQLQGGTRASPPPIFTRSSERFAFRWLQDPQRFTTLDEDLKAAMSTAATYWDWIDAGCTTMGATLPVKVVGQKRRVSDGERGGQLPCWGGINANTKNAAYQMQRSAESAAGWKGEATFNIPQEVHPLLLVDDVSLKDLSKLPQACAVIETSPNNFQATVIAPRLLTMQERKFAQFALIQLVDGDPGANSSNQLRRFPGSLNNKPSLDKVFISRVHYLSAGHTLSVDELQHLIGLGKTLAKSSSEEASVNGQITSVPSAPSMSVHSDQTTGELVSDRAKKSNSDQSASGQDFRIACVGLKRGVTESSVISAIAARAGQRKKNGKPFGDPAHSTYAEKTVRVAKSRVNAQGRVRAPFKVVIAQAGAYSGLHEEGKSS
jgi:hypothetical protein